MKNFLSVLAFHRNEPLRAYERIMSGKARFRVALDVGAA